MPQPTTQFSYRAFSQVITSDIPLPELESCASPEATVIVRRGPVCVPEAQATDADREFLAGAGDRLWFGRPGVGRFEIAGGRLITVDADPTVSEGYLRGFLLGPVIAALLHQRGYLVLHGSVVGLFGRAVVLLGNSGKGKSTTAAALMTRGYPVLSDDIVAIRSNGDGTFLVEPGYPEVCLWPDALTGTKIDPALVRPVEGRTKHSLRPSEGFPQQPLHPACIYALEVGDNLGIEPLAPRHGVRVLYEHSFGPHLARFGAAGDLLVRCARVAERVSVRTLRRTSDLNDLPELTDLIERDVTETSNYL